VRNLAPRIADLPAPVLDLALAVALTLVEVAVLFAYRDHLHPFGLAVALVATENLPLVWRRSHPMAVFVAIGTARVVYDQLGFGYAPLPLGPAIAVFTVVDLCGRRSRAVLGVLLVAGLFATQRLPGHNEPNDAALAVLVFATAWMAGALNRTRRAYLGTVEDRAERAEEERDRAAVRAATEERTRIARELHDVVAHHVSLIAVQAEAAGSLLPGEPDEANRAVGVIGNTARQALVELRRLLNVLRTAPHTPELAPAPSVRGLDAVMDPVRRAGMQVDFETVGSPFSLAPGIDLTAYRIVQEALTNAMRHAGSSRVTVRLTYQAGSVAVCVADSGPGPVASEVRMRSATTECTTDSPTTPGFGLAGIAERVASCGGTLTFGPTEAGGFHVSARLPTP
jgi:signal transduction histidine kinase